MRRLVQEMPSSLLIIHWLWQDQNKHQMTRRELNCPLSASFCYFAGAKIVINGHRASNHIFSLGRKSINASPELLLHHKYGPEMVFVS